MIWTVVNQMKRLLYKKEANQIHFLLKMFWWWFFCLKKMLSLILKYVSVKFGCYKSNKNCKHLADFSVLLCHVSVSSIFFTVLRIWCNGAEQFDWIQYVWYSIVSWHTLAHQNGILSEDTEPAMDYNKLVRTYVQCHFASVYFSVAIPELLPKQV